MQLICPFCGAEHTDYFANVERDDWTILQFGKCLYIDDVECKGCEEIAEITSEVECPNCEETYSFYAMVRTHCKEGESVWKLRAITLKEDQPCLET